MTSGPRDTLGTSIPAGSWPDVGSCTAWPTPSCPSVTLTTPPRSCVTPSWSRGASGLRTIRSAKRRGGAAAVGPKTLSQGTGHGSRPTPDVHDVADDNRVPSESFTNPGLETHSLCDPPAAASPAQPRSMMRRSDSTRCPASRTPRSRPARAGDHPSRVALCGTPPTRVSAPGSALVARTHDVVSLIASERSNRRRHYCDTAGGGEIGG